MLFDRFRVCVSVLESYLGEISGPIQFRDGKIRTGSRKSWRPAATARCTHPRISDISDSGLTLLWGRVLYDRKRFIIEFNCVEVPYTKDR